MPTSEHTGAEVEIVLDASGLVLSVNAAREGQRLVADVIEGASLCDHVHPEDYDFFLWSARWILNAPRRQQTIQLRWARAQGRYARVNATLASDNGETVSVIFHPDQTEQARRAEAQLRCIVEGSAQGVCVRTNTEVLFINEAFAHMAGFASMREMSDFTEAEARAGRNINNSIIIHPDDRALVGEHMRRRLAGEEAISRYEFRLQQQDGTLVWVEARATLVHWDGQPASLSWMSDVNARKTMELELVQSKEAAEYANRTKTEFLANMSHELRTPLNAIIGFAEVIQGEMFGPVGIAKYVEYARDIHASGRHLLELINDILDLSKIESGKLELRAERIAIGPVVEECLTLVRNRAQKSDVALKTDIAPGLPLLTCDARALKQVLLNFLSNAVKFTPAGGTVTTGAAHAADGGLTLWVRDTGIGMKDSDIAVALSAFGQIDSKIARKHKGTGLGLPISKSLIELHGGTLTIASAPGEGTTMTAHFPAARLAAKTDAA